MSPCAKGIIHLSPVGRDRGRTGHTNMVNCNDVNNEVSACFSRGDVKSSGAVTVLY